MSARDLFHNAVRHGLEKGQWRIYHTVLHFDIKDGKIWLQQNTTDLNIGQELIKMGIPKTDIVLGLHPAYKRPYTGYGVA